MTDLEKIAYAKSFIDKLALGIDPTDGTPIPEDDVAAKSRVVGCFSYVSEVLGKLVNAPNTVTDLYRTQDVKITAQLLATIECSQSPVSVSAFAQRIDVALRLAKKFTAADLNSWLLEHGYIEKLRDYKEKSYKRPTPKGIEIGIVLDQYTTLAGKTTYSVKLNQFAQRFIRDRLPEIMAGASAKTNKLRTEIPTVSFSLSQEQLSKFEYSATPISISQFTSMLNMLNLDKSQTGLKAADLASWLVSIGLLEVIEHNGKSYKLPTQQGRDLGISVDRRQGAAGDYLIALYDQNAQRFITDNLHGLIQVRHTPRFGSQNQSPTQ